jgi:dTDP-4-dehydrorhamnose reductase
MRVLITGGTGLLGKALVGKAGGRFEIIATYSGNYQMRDTGQIKYYNIDIRDEQKYRNLFKDFKPEAVIHAAGIGNPDYAQKFKKETRELNFGGTKSIIKNCEKFGSKFIYISSNAIYDGNRAPYGEEDEARPVNYYGQIKLECEKITKKTKAPWAIVRPILMYGWNYAFERQNVITIGISKLRKNDKFFVYGDVYYNPLYYYSCAEAIWAVIEKNKFEIFNIAGKDRKSIYELMREVASVFGLNEKLLIPVKQGFFKELVKRPRDTSYNTAKMESVLKIRPLGIMEGLELMKREEGALYA